MPVGECDKHIGCEYHIGEETPHRNENNKHAISIPMYGRQGRTKVHDMVPADGAVVYDDI